MRLYVPLQGERLRSPFLHPRLGGSRFFGVIKRAHVDYVHVLLCESCTWQLPSQKVDLFW